MIGPLDDPVLLARVYAEILRPAFTDDELVNLEDFVRGAVEGELAVLAAIEDEVIEGAVVCERHGAAVLIDWLAVDQGTRGGGVGGALLDAAVKRWLGEASVQLVFAEVERPDVFAADPVRGDPQRRLDFYARRGAALVDLPYFQPPIYPGMPRVHGLLLLAFAREDRGLPPRRIEPPESSALHELILGTIGPAVDAETRVLHRALDAGPRLLPPDEYRSVALSG